MAAHCRPGITTVDVPAARIGAAAARALLAGRQADAGAPPAHVCLELELIVRGSTAPPEPHPKARRGARPAGLLATAA
jgi:LacI family transcriptional regulator